MLFLIAIMSAGLSLTAQRLVRETLSAGIVSDLYALAAASAVAILLSLGLCRLIFGLGLSQADEPLRHVPISASWGSLVILIAPWVGVLNEFSLRLFPKGSFWAIVLMIGVFFAWATLVNALLRAAFGEAAVRLHWDYVDKKYRTWKS